MENPWGLIVYFDETVPGDPLRLDQRKKVHGCICGYQELGVFLPKARAIWVSCSHIPFQHYQTGAWEMVPDVEGVIEMRSP